MCVGVYINKGVPETYKIICERIKLSVENKSYGIQNTGCTIEKVIFIHT